MRNTFLLIVIACAFIAGAAVVMFDLPPTAYVRNRLLGPDHQYGPQFIHIAGDVSDTSMQGRAHGGKEWDSEHLGARITVLPGVFNPYEAEWRVLPLMQDHAGLFAGKRVMEIGTGSGIISLYAAKLGARKVVSTDISSDAIYTIKQNASDLGYDAVIDARLVPMSDISAYSVIEPIEQFDIIISNPPYALDLEASGNDAVTDTGELGFSIVHGLERHLAPGGTVILLYDSLFYHQVMAKFAAHSGYSVRNHNPNGLYPWAAESLFNSYLQRLLAHENMDPDAFGFDYSKDVGLQIRYLRNYALDPRQFDFDPLFDPPAPHRYYPGMIVIRRPPDA